MIRAIIYLLLISTSASQLHANDILSHQNFKNIAGASNEGYQGAYYITGSKAKLASYKMAEKLGLNHQEFRFLNQVENKREFIIESQSNTSKTQKNTYNAPDSSGLSFKQMSLTQGNKKTEIKPRFNYTTSTN